MSFHANSFLVFNEYMNLMRFFAVQRMKKDFCYFLDFKKFHQNLLASCRSYLQKNFVECGLVT